MREPNSDWQNNGFIDEEDEFDKTVSAFSGQPIPKKKEEPVEEEEFTATFDEDEEDDFDRTVSAFAERKSVSGKRQPSSGVNQYEGTQKREHKKQSKGFWSTVKGKIVKYVCILCPLVAIGLLTGPGAVVIIPFALWLVFWKLK